MARSEIRVSVRSGWGPLPSDPRGGPRQRIRVVVVEPSRPHVQPVLWLRDGDDTLLAHISGRDTLRKLRDALTEALDGRTAGLASGGTDG